MSLNAVGQGGIGVLWIILIVLVIAALIAVISAANSFRGANESVDALALQERLKRTHPDSPLSQLGPHEFQRSYSQANFRRLQHLQRGGLLWFCVGFVAAGAVLALLWEQSGFWAMCFAIIALGGIFYMGRERVRRTAPEVLDLMHTQHGG